MELKIFKNADEIAKYAAGIFKEVLNNNQRPVLGMATGSSPVKTYEQLIEMYKNDEISFENVLSFNLDEYYGLDKSHEQSYHYFMMDKLYSHVNINKDNVNVPSGIGNIDEVCEHYNSILSEQKIDVQILGIGSNGHIGFNEPGTSFDSVTHYIELDESTRKDNSIYFDSLEDVPTHAVTMGLKSIMQANKIVLIATGKNKAWAVNKLINGEVTTQVPASILQNHSNVEILIDEDAASEL